MSPKGWKRTLVVPQSIDEMLHRIIVANTPSQPSLLQRGRQVDAAEAQIEVAPILALRPAHERVLALPYELVLPAKQHRQLARRVIRAPVRND